MSSDIAIKPTGSIVVPNNKAIKPNYLVISKCQLNSSMPFMYFITLDKPDMNDFVSCKGVVINPYEESKDSDNQARDMEDCIKYISENYVSILSSGKMVEEIFFPTANVVLIKNLVFRAK